MFEYIFFHDKPRQQFIQYLMQHEVPYTEQDDSMGMIVAVPEDLDEKTEVDIETRYDELMENTEELLIEDGDTAEKDVAAITNSLQGGETVYASVDPKVLNRILGAITTQELNDLVNSIVSSVENPDERPFCSR